MAMSETVFVLRQCPGCGGDGLIPAGAGSETISFCQDCDIESELYCSVREACVGYFPLAGSEFEKGALTV